MSATSVVHWLARDEQATGVLVGILESVGLTALTLQKLRDPAFWGPDEVVDMQTALREIIYGGARLAHFQEIDIPAQYTAKIIAEFVHPFNWMVACHSFKKTYERSELKGIDERVTPIDAVSPTKLFAYVEEWAGGDRQMLSELLENVMTNRSRKKAV